MPDVFVLVHRRSIIALAARNKVPTIYPGLGFTRDGVFTRAVGSDPTDLFLILVDCGIRMGFFVAPSLRTYQFNCRLKFRMTLNTSTAKALQLGDPFVDHSPAPMR